MPRWCLAGLGIFLSLETAAQTPFHQQIFIPANLDKEVTEAVQDMADYLEKATGSKYSIQESGAGSSGIHLHWESQADIASSVKDQLNKDGQSFYLVIDGPLNASITGNGKSSFINGIYTFLQELGFRWYMPGDSWTIIPNNIGSGIFIKKVYTPDFRNRIYAGAGGMAAIPGVDPKNLFKKDFDRWNLRNRFSSDYYSKGHTGHLFYNIQKKELDKDPSLFCKGKIDPYGRIDISKRKAVDLFVQWALGQVKATDPYPVIGVDPSDGSEGEDDCLPANMPGIKSWSDKYFWLANRVAASVPDSDKKTIVQLYAYGAHAPTPGFDLDKRVYPVIIPYAFQRVNTPEEFIKLWHRKLDGRAMGIYDYWNITQWSVDVPQFNIYTIPEKLRFWKQHNITTVHLESTNAKGPMGHSLWLGSQMMWNTNLSFDSLYSKFLEDCFGPAAPDVKKMYDRWSLNYQGSMEANLSLQDLAAASARTKDPAIQARLTELKAYVRYLKLYYNYQDNASATAYNSLINYIHQIHSLRLVQTWPLQAYYIKPPKNYTKPANKKTGDVVQTDIKDLYAVIEKNFKEDIDQKKYSYRVQDFSFNIAKARLPASDIKNTGSFVTGPNRYQFNIPARKTIQFSAGSTTESKFTILDNEGKMVFQKNIAASKTGYTEISAKLPAGKYSLLIGVFGGFTRIVFPADMVFVSSSPTLYYDNAHFPLLYLYVPEGVTEIVYEDKNGPGTNKRGFWIDPDGKKINPEKIEKTIYRVPVPSNQRGKTWTLDIGHRAFSVLNIPNSFSLTNFNYKEK